MSPNRVISITYRMVMDSGEVSLVGGFPFEGQYDIDTLTRELMTRTQCERLFAKTPKRLAAFKSGHFRNTGGPALSNRELEFMTGPRGRNYLPLEWCTDSICEEPCVCGEYLQEECDLCGDTLNTMKYIPLFPQRRNRA